MAVTLTDNFTVIDGADGLTGWTSSGAAVHTGFQREDSGALGDQASEGFEDPYFGISATDYTGRTLFLWMRSGNPDTEANDGFGINIGDGTDHIAYTVGGSDAYGHFVLGWSGFRLDLANLPTNFRVLAGVEADLTLTALTRIGPSLSYVSKANGNSDNIFWDQMTWIANGNPGLIVAGGGDRGPRDLRRDRRSRHRHHVGPRLRRAPRVGRRQGLRGVLRHALGRRGGRHLLRG